MKQTINTFRIEIMNVMQMIEDERGPDGLPLTNEELDALYTELKRLHILKTKS